MYKKNISGISGVVYPKKFYQSYLILNTLHYISGISGEIQKADISSGPGIENIGNVTNDSTLCTKEASNGRSGYKSSSITSIPITHRQTYSELMKGLPPLYGQ